MGHLYVVQGKSGLIKVGRTACFKSRLTGLKREFKKFGDSVAKTHCCEFVDDSSGGEYGLIVDVQKILPPYFGREWFASGDFSSVCELADKNTARIKALPKPQTLRVNKEQYLRSRLVQQEKRMRALEQRKTFLEERRKEIRQRKAIRTVRQLEILRRDAEKLGYVLVAVSTADKHATSPPLQSELSTPQPTPALTATKTVAAGV